MKFKTYFNEVIELSHFIYEQIVFTHMLQSSVV